MHPLLEALLSDEAGFIVSAELVVIATVLVLGLTTALVAVRDSVGGELNDLAHSIRNLDQSYYFSGIRGCQIGNFSTSWTSGSAFTDGYLRTTGPVQDFCGSDIVLRAAPQANGVKGFCPAPSIPVTPPPGYTQPGPVLQGPSLPSPQMVYPQTILSPQSTDCPQCQKGSSSQYVSPPYGVFGNGLPTTQLPKVPQGPLQVW